MCMCLCVCMCVCVGNHIASERLCLCAKLKWACYCSSVSVKLSLQGHNVSTAAGRNTGPDCAELIGGGIHVKNILMTENKSGQEEGLASHSSVI